MRLRALKAKQNLFVWASAKRCKIFSKINNSVKNYLQKWIISHPCVIKYPIPNDYITVKFYDGNREVNTELLQKVLIQVSVRKLPK